MKSFFSLKISVSYFFYSKIILNLIDYKVNNIILSLNMLKINNKKSYYTLTY